jgi:hypothetical protein
MAALDPGAPGLVSSQVADDRVEERADAFPETVPSGGHDADERFLDEVLRHFRLSHAHERVAIETIAVLVHPGGGIACDCL